MTTRHAACSCGQLKLTCEGEPVRISICHCIECQKRTGAPFGAQARFPRAKVAIEGQAKDYVRVAESGHKLTSRFCPVCGSTVYWTIEPAPDLIAVAVGAFGDPAFPTPNHSVWERTRHAWVTELGRLPMEHLP